MNSKECAIPCLNRELVANVLLTQCKFDAGRSARSMGNESLIRKSAVQLWRGQGTPWDNRHKLKGVKQFKAYMAQCNTIMAPTR